MDRLLGRSHWNKLTQNRILQYKGQYKSIIDIYKILNELKPVAPEIDDLTNDMSSSSRRRIMRRRKKKMDQQKQLERSQSTGLLYLNATHSSTTSSTVSQSFIKHCKKFWQLCSSEVFDNRTVIVRPLPPLEAPMRIKSLTTYDAALSMSQRNNNNQPTDFMLLKQKKDRNTFIASDGLSEVKTLSGSVSDNSFMMIEDIP